MSEPPVPTDIGGPVAPAEPAVTADPGDMSVIEHLEELRWRIIKSGGAVVAAAIAVFAFHEPIIRVLERPLQPGTSFFGGMTAPIQLIFTSPGEYFVAVVKVALLGGLYLALPVILFQLMAFVAPGLTKAERRWVLPVVAGAFVFFTIGMVFSYFLLLPAGLQFLVGFAPSDVTPMLSIGKYLGFAAGLVFAAGLAFQLPLFLLGASAAGIVTSYLLARYRRYALFVAFVLAAILTPSIDIFTQVMLAGALYLLFELSIYLIRLTGK